GNAFRYVRYFAPGQGFGNVAEIEFWGKDATAKSRPPVAPPKAAEVKDVIIKGHAPSPPKSATQAAGAAGTRPAATQRATTVAAASQPATAPASYRITLAADDQMTGAILDWSEKSLRLGTALGEGGKLEIPVESLREV